MDFSTAQARTGFVANHAPKYGLDIAVVCAVIEQESDWYTFAYRYEPAFFNRYIAPQANLHSPSEAHARSASFGLMQVMGQVARELGFTGPSLLELTDPDIGVEYGCKRLQQAFHRHGGDLELSLLDYNGGGNPQYADQVIARIQKYKGA